MFQFKPLTEKDYSQWYELWQQYLLFYETVLSEDITQTVWQRIIANPAIIESIGLFENEKLVGFMHFHSQINTWKIGKVYYLEDLFVLAEYRGRGLGRGLIEHLYQLAEENNYSRIYWFTDRKNIRAKKLYDKLAKQTEQIIYKYEL